MTLSRTMDALSSWLEMAPGSGSSLASSKNSRFSFPRRERAAFRDFSLRCACRLGGRRGGGVSGALELRGEGPGGQGPATEWGLRTGWEFGSGSNTLEVGAEPECEFVTRTLGGTRRRGEMRNVGYGL